MDYEVVIIGAGVSGLAAGIRLAMFGKRVVILERHYAYGGLNSYYKIGRREFDVGLHALTNYAPRGARNAPLSKLLRQLRIDWDEFRLGEQFGSEVRFPGRKLRFTNDPDVLASEIAREFPGEIDAYHRFVQRLVEYDDLQDDPPRETAQEALAASFRDPLLREMLVCPILFYGSPEENDLQLASFATLFKSIFLQGFSRPVGGVRTLLTLLVKRFRSLGGELRMRTGVRRIHHADGRVRQVELDDGAMLTADNVLSSAGYFETFRLCDAEPERSRRPGRLSFVELMAAVDRAPAELGWPTTILFYNHAPRFDYAVPDELVDRRSGIVCVPNNYYGSEADGEGLVRLTWLANHGLWSALSADGYAAAKAQVREQFLAEIGAFIPTVQDHVVMTDAFTPRTIERYTGHLGGAVYGSPDKCRDGRTPWRNLFLCGTDQGFLGIIGAMLSGISMANRHVLAAD